MSNYYEILGVACDSEASAIRSAYLGLISKYHPDTGQLDPAYAERLSKLINEAYSVLRQHQSRAAYDETLRARILPIQKRVAERALPKFIRPIPSRLRFWRTRAFGVLAFGILGLVAFSISHWNFPTFNGVDASAYRFDLLRGSLREGIDAANFARRSEPSKWAAERVAQRPLVSTEAMDLEDTAPDPFAELVFRQLRRLNREDLLTVQLSCASPSANRRDDFETCLRRDLNEVEAGATYPLNVSIGEDAKTGIQVACAGERVAGPGIYNACLSSELARLRVRLKRGRDQHSQLRPRNKPNRRIRARSQASSLRSPAIGATEA